MGFITTTAKRYSAFFFSQLFNSKFILESPGRMNSYCFHLVVYMRKHNSGCENPYVAYMGLNFISFRFSKASKSGHLHSNFNSGFLTFLPCPHIKLAFPSPYPSFQYEQFLDWLQSLDGWHSALETLDLPIFYGFHLGWGPVNTLNSFLKANSGTLNHLSIGID